MDEQTQAPTVAVDPAADVAPDDGPAAVAGAESCEARIINCDGGWAGCVHVVPDASSQALIGVGENAGSSYRARPDYELCTGGSLSACRPAVMDGNEWGIACVTPDPRPTIPQQAPFTCALVDGACVQGPDPASMPSS